MLKNLGSWLGLASPTAAPPDSAREMEEPLAEQRDKVVEAQNEVNKPQPVEPDGEPGANRDLDDHGKGLSGEC